MYSSKMEDVRYIQMISNLGNDSYKNEVLSFEQQKEFESLVNEYSARLLNVASKMLSDSDAAADIVQEVFISFYQKRYSFKGDCSVYTWLYRITSNRCIDYIRKLKRENKYKLKISSIENVTEDSHDEKVHDNMVVIQALSKLEPKFREPLLLAEYEGMSYIDIANTLGVEVNTVRTRIFRARKKLLSIFKKHGVTL